MLILVIGFIVSLIPSVALYMWFKGLHQDGEYKENCKKTFLSGLFAVIPVVALSAAFAILNRLLFSGLPALLVAAVYNFIVLALAEELVKYHFGRKTIDRLIGKVSWLDVIVYMGIVGIAFGLAEDIPFAIGASIPMMIIRGVTVSHGVYGMMAGYFLGRIMKGGNRKGLSALLVPWLYHGLYDFSLSEEFAALGEWTVFVSVGLAIGELILLIVFILFIRKARNDEKYTAPLFPEEAAKEAAVKEAVAEKAAVKEATVKEAVAGEAFGEARA